MHHMPEECGIYSIVVTRTEREREEEERELSNRKYRKRGQEKEERDLRGIEGEIVVDKVTPSSAIVQ